MRALVTFWCSVISKGFSSVQFSCSVMSDSLQPHGLQHTRPPCPSPAPGVYSNSCPLSVTPSNRLILCHLLFLSPSIFPSIRVFSSQSVLHIRWPKYWSFSFSIHPSYEYSGLISFRMGWLDLLAVQGTLKSLLQHHSSKASILRCSMATHSSTLAWKIHGRRSLVGYSPRGREESDMTERLHFHFSLSCIGEGNGNPLQHSCLENPRDGGAWWAAIYGVTESDMTDTT